jgi:hypothetical protein
VSEDTCSCSRTLHTAATSSPQQAVRDRTDKTSVALIDSGCNATVALLNSGDNTTTAALNSLDNSGMGAARGGNWATEGIYEFTTASGKTYVGQSGNITTRINQHLWSGKFLTGDIGTVRTTWVPGGRLAREVAEQRRILELGGIKGGQLANIRNPIGARRWHLMEGQ